MLSNKEVLLMTRREARESFWFFVEMLEYNLVNEREHRLLCDFLDVWWKCGDRLGSVCASRGSFKTTISLAFALWTLARDYETTIALDGRTIDNVISRLRALKDQINGRRYLLRLFSGLRVGGISNEEELLVTGKKELSKKEVSVVAIALDASFVGLHPHFIICDDLVDHANSKTVMQRDGVLLHLRALMPLIGGEGRLLFFHTPWGDACTDGNVMFIQENSVVEYCRPAWGNWDGDIINLTSQPREMVLNFPTTIPFEALLGLRKGLGLGLFSSQYQLEAMPSEDAMFNMSLIKTVMEDELDMDSFRKYITIDPAGDPTLASTSKRKDGDNVAVVVCGVKGAQIVFLDGVYGRFTEIETIENVMLMLKKWKPFVTGIERSGLGNLIVHLRERVRRANMFDVFVDFTPKGVGKASRIAGLTPFVETGNFMIYNHAGGKDRLLYEMSRCRRGGGLPERDDVIDAMAMVLDLRRQYGIPVESEEEKKEEKWRDVDARTRAAWERDKVGLEEGCGEMMGVMG